MHKVLGASQVCPEKLLFGISDYLSNSIKQIYLFSSCQRHPRVVGKEVEDSCGCVCSPSRRYVNGKGHPSLQTISKKALYVEPGNNELDTPPTTVMSESGMVVTRAQQLKQDEFEESDMPRSMILV